MIYIQRGKYYYKVNNNGKKTRIGKNEFYNNVIVYYTKKGQPYIKNEKGQCRFVCRHIRKGGGAMAQFNFNKELFHGGLKVFIQDYGQNYITNLILKVESIYDNTFRLFHFTKVLGKGSYGSVIELTSACKRFRLAAKIMDNSSVAKEESYFTDSLQHINCGILKGGVLAKPGDVSLNGQTIKHYIILLEHLDGSLMDIRGTLSVDTAVGIVREVQKQLLCVVNSNPSYIYKDIKLENIMFGKLPNGRYRVVVGDLGSFNNKAYTTHCLDSDTTDQCISFLFGILFADLMGINITPLHGRTAIEMTSKFGKKKYEVAFKTHLQLIYNQVYQKVKTSGFVNAVNNLHPDPLYRPRGDTVFAS